jgi:hypothetical protein
MPEPIPEQPEDANVAEEEPAELGQHEAVNLLANDARERLHADGFTDSQIRRWAETFITENSAGEADDFIAWIAAQESSP